MSAAVIGGSDEVSVAQTGDSTLDAMPSGKTPVDESRSLSRLNRIGRFALIREIGAGGMGSVFSAYDEKLDRKVALKILRSSRGSTERQRERTLREARAAARIAHPNVIPVYEVGEQDGNIHIAMEYVEGGTLLKWQSQGGRAWRDTLAMYLQVGEGLLAAHKADVVHRDFKPDNVLVGLDGRPRVVDFGLARVSWVEDRSIADHDPQDFDSSGGTQSAGRLTSPGVISGTPGYMSPEQYRGGDVDARSDQWSFCAALFSALYGYLPFTGKSVSEYARSVQGPPRPRPADTTVPDEVHRALLRGLAAHPDRRFPSMAELLAALSVEHRDDVSAGRLSRRRFSIAMILVTVGLLVLFQIRRSHQIMSAQDGVATSIVALSAVLISGFWRRRTLFENRFHRSIWILVLVMMLQNLLDRMIGTVFHLPMRMLFPFDMIVLAGGTAILSTTLFRRFRFMPLLPLLSLGLALFSSISSRFLALTYPLLVILGAIAWSLSSRSRTQTKTASSR